jgi:polysaccharide export outer membrane protein
VLAEDAPSKKANGYLIGPGDIVEILVWKEPDISRTVHVRPDGRISLPLVDDVRAAGKTPVQLKDSISKALGSFIDNPSVYVMLQENRSKKVYVVGAVAAPGEYLLEKPTTVLQAIAMAGGFGEWAKKDDIVILRKGANGQSRIEFDYERVVSGKDVAQNIRLRADDIIVVP